MISGTSNYRAGVDAASPLLFAFGHQWRRATDQRRSATSTILQMPRILILAPVLATAGCSRAPVVTITNHSSVTLSNVVVSGSGFSELIASVGAGAQRQLTVHPKSESWMRIAFDAGGQHVDSGEQGYFEAGGGYRVSATVGTNLSVSVSSDLRSY
jgi:hypothetical protein